MPNINDTRIVLNRTAVTGNYTVTTNDVFIGVTSTTAAFTITIPETMETEIGRIIDVVDESLAAGTNNITIALTAGSTSLIEGTATLTISANGGAYQLYWTSTQWKIR
jgi:hypothetical protein